jgi:hypothetical protein
MKIQRHWQHMVHHNTQNEDKQNKTQHRKLKNQQHEPHQKLRVNPGAREW